MTVVFIVVGVIVLAVIAQLATGKFNDVGAIPLELDAPLVELPKDPAEVTPEKIDGLRFGLALRGYRINQVDSVLDQLSATVASQSAEIDRLKGAQIQTSQTEG